MGAGGAARTPGAVHAIKAVRGGLESWLRRSSLVPTAPFLDPSAFDWIPRLERGWADIRAEVDALLATAGGGTPSPTPGWETIFLRYFGMRRPPLACARCPRTSALLAAVPHLRSASLSLLYPGATIAPHRGPYGGVIRYHLGVKIPPPADACGLRVGGQVRHWREGESLVFDESYEHEAWNHTDGLRVVLFLDIVRPLRQPARTINSAALRAFAWTPIARDAKQRHLAWERTLTS